MNRKQISVVLTISESRHFRLKINFALTVNIIITPTALILS
jgi:hypothetical protein